MYNGPNSRGFPMLLTCTSCGGEYHRTPSRAGQSRFCSRACSRLPTRPCVICSTVFKPTFGCGDQPTCSRECGAVYRRTGSESTCETCAKPFYVPRARANVARCCSVECLTKWQGRNKDTYHCKTCAKPFRWSPSRKTQANPTYCTPKCRDADPARTEMLRAMNALQGLRLPNKLEARGYYILNRLKVAYTPQHLIGGKFCVDAFVASADLVIQFDGDYWHGNADRFPNPDRRQLRRMTMDRSQDAYMAACGYRVLRIWEHVIQKRPSVAASSILIALRPREQ